MGFTGQGGWAGLSREFAAGEKGLPHHSVKVKLETERAQGAPGQAL